MEKLYFLLSVIMFAILTAINFESGWRFIEIEGLAAMLWIMVELVCGAVRDIVDIVREDKHRG